MDEEVQKAISHWFYRMAWREERSESALREGWRKKRTDKGKVLAIRTRPEALSEINLRPTT